MALNGSYCPYELQPLGTRIAGIEFSASTAFGRLRCLRTDANQGGTGTVFVHGVHDDIDSWGPLVHAANLLGADLGPALFIDLPGFGRSENLRGSLDLTEVGDALMEVAGSELGLSPVRLVGHSMGTLVVADMAVRHAARVQSLHLAAGPYYSIVEAMNGRWPGGIAGARATATIGAQYLLALTGEPGVRALRGASRRGWLRPLLHSFAARPDALRQSVVDHLVAGMRPRSFRAAARNGIRYRQGMLWSAVSCPVWAAYGEADRLVPAADARRLLADLPHARISVLPDASHLLHVEQPHSAVLALGLA